MTEQTFSVLISGKVQGVFFRSALKNLADNLGVRGWVRNLSDGRVEAVIQGSPSAVKRIIEWCRVGPSSAVVQDVCAISIEEKNAYRNFVILH